MIEVSIMSELSSFDLMLADLCSSLESTTTATTAVSSEMAEAYNLTNLTLPLGYSDTEAVSYLRNICFHSGMSVELPNTVSVLQQVQHYLSGVGVSIVCLFGLIGNFLTIKVLLRREYRNSSTYVYLTGLTISDTLLLVSAIFLCVKDLLAMKYDITLSAYSGYTFPIVHPLANVFHCTSIWLTVGFTVDRYIMICHPYDGSKFCNRKRAIITVIGIFVFGILYNIPRFFEYETEIIPNVLNDKTYTIAKHTKLGASKQYLRVVHFWLYLFCMFLLPCVTLCILNTMLVVAVKKSRRKGRRMSLGIDQAPKNDTTFMLVAIVVVFLVCQLPALIIKTLFASEPEKFLNLGTEYDYLNIIQEVTNFLVILNSAINILLYCVFSRKFRKSFTKAFCCKCILKSKFMVNELTRRMSISRKSSVMGESVMSKSRLSEASLGGGATTNNSRLISTTRKGHGNTSYMAVATFAPVTEELGSDDSHQSDPKAEELVGLTNLNLEKHDHTNEQRKDSGIWIRDDSTSV